MKIMENETIATKGIKIEATAQPTTILNETTIKITEQTNERVVPTDTKTSKDVPSNKNTQGYDNASFRQSASIISTTISCLLAILIF
jgi:phage gp45-like